MLISGARWGRGCATKVKVGSVDFGKMRIDVADRGELMQGLAREQREYFKKNHPEYFKKPVIENPKNIKEWIAKKFIAFDTSSSRQISTYGQRMSMTMMNHVNNPDWAALFGVQEMYLEITMWLWAIHMWLVQKRLWVMPESKALGNAMHGLYTQTAQQRLAGIYDSTRERNLGMDRMQSYFSANLSGLDEGFGPECQYRDALLMYALYRNAPFEHREEVPVFAWYTLMQYIRLHLAVFDRIPNSEFKQGFFYFYHPLDPDVFERPTALDSPKYVPDLLLGKRGPKMPETEP